MEIRDPVSKQIVKKHMKPFMVNLCARRMEDGQVIFPESEDIKNGLVGQIRDYTVIRTTALGQPVYSDENDHAIAAWMLSVLAATMEFSDINRQSRTVSIGIAGKFGEKLEKDFQLSRGKVEEEKRKRLAINPRWFGKATFQETTARNTLDFFRAKDRKIEGRKKENQINKLSSARYTKSSGRSNF
jgi:hypothetical protein